jgi:hypothetical protein
LGGRTKFFEFLLENPLDPRFLSYPLCEHVYVIETEAGEETKNHNARGAAPWVEVHIRIIEPNGWSVHELRLGIRELERVRRENEAAMALLVGAIPEGRDAAADIARSAGISNREARRRRRVADVVAKVSGALEKLASGSVSEEHIAALAPVADMPGASSLLEDAESSSPEEFANKVEQFRLSASCGDDMAKRQRARRALRFYSGPDGMIGLTGLLPPIEGTELKNRLAAVVDARWRAEHPERASVLGGHGGDAHEQRMADALLAITGVDNSSAEPQQSKRPGETVQGNEPEATNLPGQNPRDQESTSTEAVTDRSEQADRPAQEEPSARSDAVDFVGWGQSRRSSRESAVVEPAAKPDPGEHYVVDRGPEDLDSHDRVANDRVANDHVVNNHVANGPASSDRGFDRCSEDLDSDDRFVNDHVANDPASTDPPSNDRGFDRCSEDLDSDGDDRYPVDRGSGDHGANDRDSDDRVGSSPQSWGPNFSISVAPPAPPTSLARQVPLTVVKTAKPAVVIIFDIDRWQARIAGGKPIPITESLLDHARNDLYYCFKNTAGEILKFNRSRRDPTAVQRLALVVRDERCMYPGCHAPPEACDAHHTDEVVKDRGLTNLEVMALFCKAHHRHIHLNDLVVIRETNGTITIKQRKTGAVVVQTVAKTVPKSDAQTVEPVGEQKRAA